MHKDPIVEEIHRFRREHSRKFKGDLAALFAEVREEELKSGRKIVSRVARAIKRSRKELGA